MPHRVPIPFPVRSTLTTTAIGRAFEDHTITYLNHHLHMSLRHTGGSGDEGIDFRGWWFVPGDACRTKGLRRVRRPQDHELKHTWFPSEPLMGTGIDSRKKLDGPAGGVEELGEGSVRRLRVVGQCKAEAKPLNGRAVRELEGVIGHLHGMSAIWTFLSSPDIRVGLERIPGPHNYDHSGEPIDRSPPQTLCILASQSGFSQQAMIRALRSPSPMLLVHLPGGRPVEPGEEEEEAAEEGLSKSILVKGATMNPSLASETGLLGGMLELRREEMNEGGTRYRMWYKGKPMERQGPLGPSSA
jgi:hypothetical protein